MLATVLHVALRPVLTRPKIRRGKFVPNGTNQVCVDLVQIAEIGILRRVLAISVEFATRVWITPLAILRTQMSPKADPRVKAQRVPVQFRVVRILVQPSLRGMLV